MEKPTHPTPKETDCEAREWRISCTVAAEKGSGAWDLMRGRDDVHHAISFSAFEKLREENEQLNIYVTELEESVKYWKGLRNGK